MSEQGKGVCMACQETHVLCRIHNHREFCKECLVRWVSSMAAPFECAGVNCHRPVFRGDLKPHLAGTHGDLLRMHKRRVSLLAQSIPNTKRGGGLARAATDSTQLPTPSEGHAVCPGCFIEVERESGCNSMSHACPSFGFRTVSFCFLCSTRLQTDGHHDFLTPSIEHFPNGSYSGCVKKPDREREVMHIHVRDIEEQGRRPMNTPLGRRFVSRREREAWLAYFRARADASASWLSFAGSCALTPLMWISVVMTLPVLTVFPLTLLFVFVFGLAFILLHPLDSYQHFQPTCILFTPSFMNATINTTATLYESMNITLFDSSTHQLAPFLSTVRNNTISLAAEWVQAHRECSWMTSENFIPLFPWLVYLIIPFLLAALFKNWSPMARVYFDFFSLCGGHCVHLFTAASLAGSASSTLFPSGLLNSLWQMHSLPSNVSVWSTYMTLNNTLNLQDVWTSTAETAAWSNLPLLSLVDRVLAVAVLAHYLLYFTLNCFRLSRAIFFCSSSLFDVATVASQRVVGEESSTLGALYTSILSCKIALAG
eukprot:m.221997 g.221997  ORF g.221997 m.221997 type:complete len:541 (+) comp15936_c0_seq1:259-1881(+)